MHELVRRSQAIITANQAPSGAYVACPTYPTYRYCWFRDGIFVAESMDSCHEHASAARFYTWATRMVTQRAAAVNRCRQAVARGQVPADTDLLHTRYTLAGETDEGAWPNFQLDGFGTLLWGFTRHMHLAEITAPPDWLEAARLLVRYLAALWTLPNADCWEEFPDSRAVSTLATIHAGLHAAATWLGAGDPDGTLAAEAAGAVRALVLEHGTLNAHLIKQIDGEDLVDASLLWACVPFGEHSLLRAGDPLMRATVARIETDLLAATGEVHRYRADTFYGGGEWLLLTALLGQYRLAVGDSAGAQRCRAYIEGRADDQGYLAEQCGTEPLAPGYVREWIDRWGPVASPLLWSHAAYLSLRAAQQNRR
jgi:GH15 family glucan-1,4-alpha-glucosidase